MLTRAGRDLVVALGALQEWGDRHLPREAGPTVVRRIRDTDQPSHVGFIDDEGREVPLSDVSMVRAAAHPKS